MLKLIRAYYRLFKDINIGGSVLFDGKLCDVNNCKIKFSSSAKVHFGKNVSLKKSIIEVIGGELVIGDGVTISNYSISVGKGCKLFIGNNCVFEKGDNWRKPYILMWDESKLKIGNNNCLRCDIHTRFGGECEIGEYNCINERTEIRCDENIQLGSFNMISYNCRVWDTNTHTFYNDGTRRQMTIRMYPNIGAEIDKPITKSIVIGSDCLFGEESTILKGTVIGNKSVVGIRTVVSGKIIPDGSTIVGNPGRNINNV